MNVSSVKNLNGEVFSAVQDASLTNVVQTNSGNWQDIIAYQNNSASYQPSGNYIPYTAVDNSNTAFKTNSGLSIVKFGEGGLYSTLLSPNTIQMYFVDSPTLYYGAILSDTSLKFETYSDSAYLDKEKIHTWDSASYYIQNISANWNDISTTVQTNSAQWAEGGNIPVSNSGDLYKVEFDGVDLYGYKSTTTITSEPVYSAVSSHESNYIEHTPYPQWNNYAIQGLRYWSAFDVISISSNGGQIYPPDAADYGYVTALDVYYKASYLYDYNSNQLEDFSGYVGKITLDNLVISSYFDKPSYFDDIARCNEFRLWFSGNQHEGQLNNSHYICSVGNKVQTGTSTIEGILVKPTESPSSTIIVTDGNKIDCTDSAVCKTVIPSFTVTATRSSDTIRPQGEGTLHATWSDTSEGTMLTLNASIEGMLSYSSNLAQTGWLMTSPPYRTYWISLPNATAVDLWSPFSGTVSSIIVSSEAISSYEVKELAPLTALPTYEYDNTNKISAINGSAIAGGDEFPVSANEAITAYQTNSATYLTAHQAISADEWNNCYNNVNTNSGAWGGSALPISAGPGIKVNLVDNTLVFSNDETELLASTATSAFTLTEPFSSFEQVKIKLRWWDKVPDNYYNVERFTNNKCSLSWTYFDNITDGGPLELAGASWTSNNGIDYNLEGGFARTFGITSTGMSVFTHEAYPISIVGINRK